MTSWKTVHVFTWFKGLCITHAHISCPMETREIAEICEVCRASNYQVSSRIIQHPTLLKHTCFLNFSILSEAGSYKGSFTFSARFSNGVTPKKANGRGTKNRAADFPTWEVAASQWLRKIRGFLRC